MTVEDWVHEAVEQRGKTGATLREVQRYIDERHFEELAVDTLEEALEQLVKGGGSSIVLHAGTLTKGLQKRTPSTSSLVNKALWEGTQ